MIAPLFDPRVYKILNEIWNGGANYRSKAHYSPGDGLLEHMITTGWVIQISHDDLALTAPGKRARELYGLFWLKFKKERIR